MIEINMSLNIDIKNKNIVSELKEILKRNNSDIALLDLDDKVNYICKYDTRIRDFEVSLNLTFEQDKSVMTSVFISYEGEEDINELDLRLFYFEEIQNNLFIQLSTKRLDTYCVRIYQKIINYKPLFGEYLINWKNKIKMFNLHNLELRNGFNVNQILAFDIEVKAQNLDQARSISYNTVLDFSAFLSVLLDIGFYDIRSYYTHFIVPNNNDDLQMGRYLTGFFDEELELIVRNNFYNIRPFNDPSNQHGQLYMRAQDSNNVLINQIGSDDFLEKAYKDRKIKKPIIKGKYRDDINKEIHHRNEEIIIPQLIRKFFKNLLKLENDNNVNYKYFRNCCRLYNLSNCIATTNTTSSISYLISSVNALAKSEKMDFSSSEKMIFSSFVEKYSNKLFDKKLLSFLYGNIRSGHFHSGEFGFLEYNVDFNNSLNKDFAKLSNLAEKSKRILRLAIVNWINKNLFCS